MPAFQPLKLMKKLLLLIGIVLSTTLTYSQKEALTWYFGNKIRLNFHAGGNFPQQFFPSYMNARKGSLCMSHYITGTPLFYSNGEIIYDDGGNPITSNLYGDAQSLQPGITFRVPGSDNQYYVFTTGNALHKGAFYTIVDMSMNSGLGGIPDGKLNVQIPGIDSCQKVVMATKHMNNRWYWVVFRSVGERNYLYAYLVTENGISSEPVRSDCFTAHGSNEYAMSKFAPAYWSPEANGIMYCYTSDNWDTEQRKTFELYSFNIGNGVFNQKLFFPGLPPKPEEYDIQHRSNGIEFSTDGRYLYSSIMAVKPGDPQVPVQYIVQYDLSKTDNYDNFINTGYFGIGEKNNLIDIYGEMQLARDGRIYIAQAENKNNKALSRIFYPNKHRNDADFRDGEVGLSSSTESTFGLPTFVPSYFSRFDYSGTCYPDSTYFKSTFHPTPISVEWDFGDGSPTVTGFNPVHKFPSAGNYKIKATATYPREEIEEFTRIIRIENTPSFELGPDISVCPGDSVTLDVGLIPQAYLYWSIDVDSVSSITVPAGRYWLKAENITYGCIHRDTVDVIEYLAPTVDNSNLDIFPATCTGPTGYIHGVQVNEGQTGQGPFTYAWKDAGGNTVNSSLTFNSAPPGFFTLYATDIHGCLWNVNTYEVPSIGNAFIDSVAVTGTYCGNPNGTIRFKPIPIMSGLLEYTIGNDIWQTDSLFKNLPSGSYEVKARVIQNRTCENNWGTLVVEDYPRPPLTSNLIVETPELDNNSNGTLEFPILGADFMYVIIDSLGIKRQQFDNPLFTGLPSGPYLCFGYDINNCSSDTVMKRVTQIWSTLLTGKLNGAPPVCKFEHTFADLKVYNFEGIVDFTATLTYDRTKITCLPNYLNLKSELGSVDMDVNTASGRVTITWNSSTPLTLIDTVVLLRLEFSTHASGIASLNWVATSTDFIEGPGYHLLVDTLLRSSVEIYENPQLTLDPFPETCHGSPITLTANINPPGSYTYLWTRPDGFTVTSSTIPLSNPDLSNAGIYWLTITNTNGCKDTSKMELTVNPLPSVGFEDEKMYFDFPDTLMLEQNYQSYLWSTGETGPWIMVMDSGYVSVTVRDNNTCQNTFTTFVNGKKQKPFFYKLPTAFTPNGDGLNDSFRPYTDYELITKFKLMIFDTWGQMVFETDDSAKGWDGKINGLDALSGPYGWYIVYSNYNNFNVRAKGLVWLIR